VFPYAAAPTLQLKGVLTPRKAKKQLDCAASAAAMLCEQAAVV
jgi:hypothetical protein